MLGSGCIIDLNIATCLVGGFQLHFGVDKEPFLKWLQNGDLLRSPALAGVFREGKEPVEVCVCVAPLFLRGFCCPFEFGVGRHLHSCPGMQ